MNNLTDNNDIPSREHIMQDRLYPAIQADNLRAVLAHIEVHPETWNQSTWHCGASHCFFGWAQIMSGKQASDDTVRVDARKWLGLTKHEADQLSAAGNTLGQIRDLVDLFTSGDYNRDGYNRTRFDADGLSPENLTPDEVRLANKSGGAA